METMNPSAINRLLNGLAVPLVLFLLIYPSWMFGELPETIPMHFDGNGQPNGWGGRASVFVLPGVVLSVYLLVLYFVFSGAIERQAIEDPIKQPPATVPYTKMYLLWVNLATLILFAVLSYSSIEVALGHADQLRQYNLPVYLSAVLIPLPFLLRKNFKEIRQQKELLANKDR